MVTILCSQGEKGDDMKCHGDPHFFPCKREGWGVEDTAPFLTQDLPLPFIFPLKVADR